MNHAIEWFPDETDRGNAIAENIEQDNPDIVKNMESLVESIIPTECTAENFVIEETASIFLNSTAGLFFPTCHVHLAKSTNVDTDQDNKVFEDQRVEQITKWQNAPYKKQAYIVNHIIMAVLLVIFSFVTLFKFFNYKHPRPIPIQYNHGAPSYIRNCWNSVGYGIRGGK